MKKMNFLQDSAYLRWTEKRLGDFYYKRWFRKSKYKTLNTYNILFRWNISL